MACAQAIGANSGVEIVANKIIATTENLLAVMDDVYTVLITIDYPEALTGGLRRASDALRAVLERTRGDVTNALVMARMQDAIEGESPTADR